MRIVAGAAGGRGLVTPPGRDVRPTADRVREALFSSLAPRLAGAHVLDLYAGSGALGLEALSRGAATLTLVERDRRALGALRDNVARVALPGVTVVAGDVERVVGDPTLVGPFDLVLADPPYDLPPDRLDALLAALIRLLADDAVVVVERSASGTAPSWPPGLLAGASRRYGSTVLHRAARGGGDYGRGPSRPHGAGAHR